MEQPNRKKMLFLIVSVVVIIAIILVVSIGLKSDNEKRNDELATNSSEAIEPVADDNGEQFVEEKIEGKPIKMKHITFVMPEDLENRLSVEKEKHADVQKLTFSAEISDEKLELFTILMSKTEQDGYKMGVLQDEKAGDIIITVRVNQQNEEDWNEEDFKKINDLQERVNDFIYQFSEDERYVPEK